MGRKLGVVALMLCILVAVAAAAAKDSRRDSAAAAFASDTDAVVTGANDTSTQAAAPNSSHPLPASPPSAHAEASTHTASPTVRDSGSGTLIVILSATGVLVLLAAGWVAYQRFVRGVSPLPAIDMSWLGGDGAADSYEPVSALDDRIGAPPSLASPPARMPERLYPVAYPVGAGTVHVALADVSRRPETQALARPAREVAHYTVENDDDEYERI